MVRTLAALALTGASPLAAQPLNRNLEPTPATLQIFQSDWVLMNWALKYYDADRDFMLEANEAKTAADAFRRLADGNGDGRVTPQEYREARAFILARY